MRGETRHYQTAWNYQEQGCCCNQLIFPHDGAWKCQPPSQWTHDCLKGGWARESLCITWIWTCLPPPIVGPLLKLWSIQGKVYPNRKSLLLWLLLWYEPSSWWHRVPFLVNLLDAWWMHRFLESPSSPTNSLYLQAPSPSAYPSSVCLAPFPWWGRRGAEYERLVRLWPHGRVRGARFMALCFVNFCNFRDSAEYGVARSGLSEISCFYEWNRTNIFPVDSPHEEHDVKMSLPDVHYQHKIWILLPLTN